MAELAELHTAVVPSSAICSSSSNQAIGVRQRWSFSAVILSTVVSQAHFSMIIFLIAENFPLSMR
jgi:hypothetical protein